MTRRLILALTTTVLATLACGGGSNSGTGSAPTPAPTPQTVTFTETEFKIDPSTTTFKAGDYDFTAQNQGKFPHDLHIATPDGSELGKTDVLQPGGSGTFKVTLKSGTYTLWCAVQGHRARGMETKITVT
jgi:uncharacterized cupredoxin-like copper-binding protein